LRGLGALATGTANRLLLLLRHRLRRRLVAIGLDHDEPRIIQELLRVDAGFLGTRWLGPALFPARLGLLLRLFVTGLLRMQFGAGFQLMNTPLLLGE